MHFTTSVAAIGLAALLPSQVAAFFRMPCPGRLVTERADPIIFPGTVSGHVHQIAGGNGFGFTESYEDARKATCSSCPLKADLSNYWTPVLYYKSQNGTFTKVPQSGDGTGVQGGMTVYYQQRGTDKNVKAFPKGLRMIAGNPFKRNSTNDFASDAVSFVCLNYSPPSGYQGYTNQLPTQACPDGLRAQVYFPSCWDGVNLDSADHSSHMSYPATGAYNGGTCPSSHPVQLVSIFYEVIFSTAGFDWWSGDYGTNQPFVFSMGDATGYGFHGDFVNGWDVDVLQEAIDTCTDETAGGLSLCPVLYNNMFTNEESQACQIPTSVDEEIDGPLDALPGCNPVSAGPEMATAVTTCAVPPISAPKQSFTDMTSKGWAYVGCVNDAGSARTLTGYTNMYDSDQANTTVESCITKCAQEGSTYAGLENGKQCFCGNSVASDDMPLAGVIGACQAPCSGDSSQICGGSGALSTYKTCSGSSCTNAAFVAINPSIEGTGGNSGASSGSSGSSASSASSAAASSATSAVASSSGSASSSSAKVSASSIASTALAQYGDMPSSSSTSSAAAATLSSASAYGNKAKKASSTMAQMIKSLAPSSSATGSSSPSEAAVAGSEAGAEDGTCAAVATETVNKTVYVTKTLGAESTSQAAKKHRKHHAAHLRQHQHKQDRRA